MPGWGIVKGVAFGVAQMFRPKVTVQYPEERLELPPKGRGRLLLLYDEFGTLKCETCFQCAAACPIECIDMGGVDTKSRFHVHWGPAEQYAERREESALRRSGRPVPDHTFDAWEGIDLDPLDAILLDEDYSPRRLLRILERTQEAYGSLPVAAIQHISHATGAWYSEIYGIATSYRHLRFEPASSHEVAVCRCGVCSMAGAGRILAAFGEALSTELDGVSPDGRVRLTSADCGGEGGPLVLVDGHPQPRMTPDRATEIAAHLRTSHLPAGRSA
ncbi:MAG TPA: NAD(P)H-dependent oxidoreductase subunit E [Candidatus Limnocylindrales bacterium]|nr:NAD(P)H-dependent oxidoreductase subunit E [Candidatus Limnocylindrales bacterium]